MLIVKKEHGNPSGNNKVVFGVGLGYYELHMVHLIYK